jgi:DNA modification methylase
VDALTPHPRNARTHSEKQIAKIKASIEQFGFTNPILTDGDGRIIAGHGRVEAARRIGMKEVPTIRLDHLTEEQLRAYIIADNRLAEMAGWDRETLAIELQYLSEIDLDFDVEIIGFETAEIDLLIEGLDAAEPDETDSCSDHEGDVTSPVSRVGDLWLLDRHRLLCADALDEASYASLMAGDSAQMVFADPPYNVPIGGHVSGLGRTKHREFAMACGEMSAQQFQSFLEQVLRNHATACVDGGLIYACIDWRHLLQLLQAGQVTNLALINICVWNKSNGGMGSFYRSKHELVPVFKKGRAPHLNTIELGSHGRYRTNVWDYTGANTFGPNRLDELRMHPTVKPVALVADAIKDCTRRGDIVLDGFAGSGTTLIAAEKTGRIGYGLGLDPVYVDTAIRRWERQTGRKAIHAETGLTMEELGEMREVSATSQSECTKTASALAGKGVNDGE